MTPTHHSNAYPITQICDIVGGKFLNGFIHNLFIEHLLLDSRQLVFPPETLFISMVGANQNGHDYIAPLYEKGVRNFVVSQEIAYKKFPSSNFIIVENTTDALQQLAAHHRRVFSNLPVIGITGSNGKTIVKEWLFRLLQSDFNIVRSPKSYNSQIGVPLSVWQISAQHTLGIFEAGISKIDEMRRIAPLIDCQTGIFTNIGAAHSEGFSSNKEKIYEKLDLFQMSQILIFCVDYLEITEAIHDKFPDKKLFSWSQKGNKNADLSVYAVHSEVQTTTISAIFREKEIAVQIPFSDLPSIENACHCWALMLCYGYANDIIRHRISQLEPVAMRLELKSGINGCLLINDSYNSDITSLTAALNFMEQQNTLSQKTIILSDILESGWSKTKLYAAVTKLLSQKNITRLIGIGKEIKAIAPKLPNEVSSVFFDSTEDFLVQIKNSDFQQETILLKGARIFAFERIANRLSQKAHKTILEINLNALVENLQVYRSRLQPRTRVMAMIKASAYGSGSHEVGRLLESQRISYLAVAYADEGIELRQAGISLPILVLNPEEESFDAILRYRLEPEIYSLTLLKHFITAVKDSHETVNIHLKLDTGMKRLGFEQSDIEELTLTLAQYPQLRVQSIFSHLAASENPLHDEFTHQQAQNFINLYEQICKQIGYYPLRHLLNSGGIVRFPQYHFEMVRLGIGLYGIDSSAEIQPLLKVVSSLKATVSQLKTLAAGESVGYGRSGRAQQAMRIATLSVGYADGLLRAAGNGNFSVQVGGGRAPIVGNVCMDMCMIDVTQLPQVQEGDEATIFGESPSVAELAKALNTIPYEIFTTLSERVKRIYFQE